MIKCHFRFVSISHFFFYFLLSIYFFFCLCAPDCADGHCHRVWVAFGSEARLDSRDEAAVCRKILRNDDKVGARERAARGPPGGWMWRSSSQLRTWKFTTNTWRQKVGRTQPVIGILQWEYRVGIWCQYDENVDPSSFTWTLQAVIFIQSPLPTWMLCLTVFIPSLTTVDHRLLDQPEGKCISGTVCSLFSSCFRVLEPQLQTTFSKFNTKSIKLRPRTPPGPFVNVRNSRL